MSDVQFQGQYLQKLFESVEDDDVFDEDEEEIDIKTEIIVKEEQDFFYDSDQESELSDDEEQPPEKQARRDHYLGRDKTTKWMKNCPNPRDFSGPLLFMPKTSDDALQVRTILETWTLFFPDEMLQIIVVNTNKYISGISSHSSRERDAKPTDVIELKALIGLLYISGLLRDSRPNVNELWDPNGFGVERFWLTMSKHRFLFLMRCIHFADQDIVHEYQQKDKLIEIREVMNIFVKACQDMYNPSEFMTIGEILVSFRGSCPFKQYVPSKAKRYGIKMFALVDTQMPYTKNLEIDVGTDSNSQYRIGVPDAKNIVERLISPITGTFRTVTCGRRFTSFELISTLIKNHQLTFVGGVKKNTKELPKDFVDTKSRLPNSTIFGYRKDTTILSYVSENGKSIILASTMDDTKPKTSSSKTQETDKPSLVNFFNSTKEGVERVEQYCSTYDVSRFTKRWSMIMFFSFLNIGAINSYVIFLQNNSIQNLFRRVYLKQLSIELTQEHLKRRAMQKNVPPEVRQRRMEVAGVTDDGPKGDPSNPNIRKKCFLCKNRSKTRYYCHYCRKFICLKHSNFVCGNCI